MPRAFLLLLVLTLASSVRADEVTEGALAGRWKVVGTAPTAKNRDGLAELEKHGCYLYFEFAANGRAAVGIGSDSKAKLEALQKANRNVALEWSAKYEVVNGRVELSDFPAHLREPGGWLGDSATAIFRTRLDRDTLELTGPGGFVAFQKVKAQTAGATEAKAKPKADASSIAGRWRITTVPDSRTDFTGLYEKTKLYFYFEFAPDGALTFGTHSDDPNRPALKSKAGPIGKGGKYRLGPDGALELYDVDRVGFAGFQFDNTKYAYALDGGALTLTEADSGRKLEFVRARVPVAALVGTWRMVKSTRLNADQARSLEKAGTKILCVFDKDGGVTMEVRLNGGQPAPAPPGQNFAWKYRFVSDTELEFYDVPAHLRNPTGPTGDSDKAKLRFKLDGDTLEVTEADGKNTVTYAREK